MSGASTQAGKPPKAMSSRLLTMKFMQRAAASPVSSPSTPDVPSAKRRKTGDSSPIAFDVNALADQRAVEAALASEEAIRQAALDRAGAEAGDTRWVLNFEQDRKSSSSQNKPALRVVQTGFATIDYSKPAFITNPHDGEEEHRPTMTGRRSFGKFNRAIERLQNPEAESSESDSDDDDADDDEDKDSEMEESSGGEEGALVREAKAQAADKMKEDRKKKRKAEKKEAQRLAEKRKKKEVNLNALTSLSGTGNTPTKQACHKCGQVGHLQAQCPKRGRGNADEGERPRKSRKST